VATSRKTDGTQLSQLPVAHPHDECRLATSSPPLVRPKLTLSVRSAWAACMRACVRACVDGWVEGWRGVRLLASAAIVLFPRWCLERRCDAGRPGSAPQNSASTASVSMSSSSQRTPRSLVSPPRALAKRCESPSTGLSIWELDQAAAVAGGAVDAAVNAWPLFWNVISQFGKLSALVPATTVPVRAAGSSF
jgi:hypothetical protein